MKKVIVTGGAGYIGSHTVLALRDFGYPVVVIDNLSTGDRRLLPSDVNLVIGDIADQNLVYEVLKKYNCKAVMHFAASVIVPESVNDPLKYYANNTIASQNLIECCINSNIDAFIFASTAAVYGNPEQVPISETTLTLPVTPYGSSKLMTERLLHDVSAACRFPYAALRYFNVAGADPDGRSGQIGPNTTHLIRVACELATGKREKMFVYGTDYDTPDGTCIRDFIHVSDVANAHVLALRYLLQRRKSIVLNCGYGHGFSVFEVLNVIKNLVAKPLDISSSGRREGDVPRLISDPTKIRELLDWKPKFDDLKLIIETALTWENRCDRNN